MREVLPQNGIQGFANSFRSLVIEDDHADKRSDGVVVGQFGSLYWQGHRASRRLAAEKAEPANKFDAMADGVIDRIIAEDIFGEPIIFGEFKAERVGPVLWRRLELRGVERPVAVNEDILFLDIAEAPASGNH